MTQAELEQTADAVLSEMMIAVSLGAFAVIALVIVFMIRRRTRNRLRREAAMGLSMNDLKGLEKKGLLTPEEAKLVRNAVARQFLDTEKPTEQLPPGTPGLQALAIEAERAEALLRAKAEQQRVAPSPPSALPSAPPPDAAPRAAPLEDRVPEHLRALVHKPAEELNDLRNAGFLEENDLRLILAVRGESS